MLYIKQFFCASFAVALIRFITSKMSFHSKDSIDYIIMPKIENLGALTKLLNC